MNVWRRGSSVSAVVAQVSLRTVWRWLAAEEGERRKRGERGKRGSLKCDSQSQREATKPRSSTPQQPGGNAVVSNKQLTSSFFSTVSFHGALQMEGLQCNVKSTSALVSRCQTHTPFPTLAVSPSLCFLFLGLGIT